jgi:hypothetical protein
MTGKRSEGQFARKLTLWVDHFKGWVSYDMKLESLTSKVVH